MPSLQIRKDEINLLNQAFQTFNEATAKLEESYQRLEKRVESLNLELEEKNIELEKNLREKENVKNYLHDILESLPTGIVVLDGNRKITTFNKTAGEIVGIPASEALGKFFSEAFEIKKHSGFSLELLLSPDSGRHYEEIKFLNQKNVELDLSVSSSTMKSPLDGRLERTLIIQDITDVKRLEEKLERNDRLTAMGEMAAGIAHELRNPLGSIELFTSLLRRGLTEKPDMLQLADHISSGIKKMDHIISGLLTFTRSPKPNVRKYNLHEVLDDVLLFNGLLIRENKVTIGKHYGCDHPFGEGDADLLNQVFTNLLLNAVQSMPNGGALTISTKGNDGLGQPGQGSKERQLVLVFKDSGVGIPVHIKNKIFNPFFTTKDRGTGLGLSIVYSIVKAHKGSIEFESTEGKGTTFTVSLPLWPEGEN